MSDEVDVEVSAWVKIGDTSRIEYDVYRDGQVQFTIGDGDRFLLATSKYGLQNFVAHANEALRAVREASAHRDEGYTSSSILLD